MKMSSSPGSGRVQKGTANLAGDCTGGLQQPSDREGSKDLRTRKTFSAGGKSYRYQITTRGYDYVLERPVPVNVLPRHIIGARKTPLVGSAQKPRSPPPDADSIGTAEAVR